MKIVDSFCEGKYFSQVLNKKDIENLKKIRSIYPETLDKLLRQKVINEKEYKQCQNLQTI